MLVLCENTGLFSIAIVFDQLFFIFGEDTLYLYYSLLLYQFKRSSSDFIVDELLSAQPSGSGEVFYVYFQKENLTTMEVLEHLQRQLSLSREDFGIAGLKDKVGITRQWITVFHSALERA
jgi:tRNA pseudouridine13 synthase